MGEGVAGSIASQRLDRALLRSQLDRKKRQAQHRANEEEERRRRREERVREARRLAKLADQPVSAPADEDLTALEQCPVCLQDMPSACEQQSSNAELQVLECSHTFHAACIGPWLQRKQSCPLCRAPCNVVVATATPPAATLARARRPHRCGNPTVIVFRNGPYCTGCLRWLAEHEDFVPATT